MLFALADGLALRMLAEPGRDFGPTVARRRARRADCRRRDDSALRGRERAERSDVAAERDRPATAGWAQPAASPGTAVASGTLAGQPASFLLPKDGPPRADRDAPPRRLLRRRRRLVLIGVGGDPARRAAVRGAPVRGPVERRLRRARLAVGRRRRGARRDFPGVQRAQLAAVLIAASPARRAAQLRAAVDRVGDGVAARRRRRARRRRARERAPRRPPPAGPCVVPLRVAVDEDDATDVAVDLREELGGRRRRRATASRRHLVGQGALWAAMQELSKEDLAKAETAGFPIVLLILLARLRLARRGGAAARARLRLRARHRRADLRASRSRWRCRSS